MRKLKLTVLALCLLLSLGLLVACGTPGPDVVEVPGAGIVPNPNSNIFNCPEKDEELTDPWADEQESMAGSPVVVLPYLPVGGE